MFCCFSGVPLCLCPAGWNRQKERSAKSTWISTHSFIPQGQSSPEFFPRLWCFQAAIEMPPLIDRYSCLTRCDSTARHLPILSKCC